MGNLNENSLAYYAHNNFYELFSVAEDYPKFIDKKLEEYGKNKRILDAGCGTGKYTKLLSNIGLFYIGVDKSPNQIEIASTKFNKELFKISDLNNLNFSDNYFDIAISCWCLGTIDIEKRKEVLKELKRVCSKSIFLVENLENSEFEIIRGHDKDNKTKKYLDFLYENNFKLLDTIDTYFEFDNLEIAKLTFKEIYNNNVADKINSKYINHKVGIFRLDVNNDL